MYIFKRRGAYFFPFLFFFFQCDERTDCVTFVVVAQRVRLVYISFFEQFNFRFIKCFRWVDIFHQIETAKQQNTYIHFRCLMSISRATSATLDHSGSLSKMTHRNKISILFLISFIRIKCQWSSVVNYYYYFISFLFGFLYWISSHIEWLIYDFIVLETSHVNSGMNALQQCINRTPLESSQRISLFTNNKIFEKINK